MRKPTPRERVVARLRRESGFTLIELMVSCTIFVVVMTAILALLDVSNQTAYNDQERSTAIIEDSAGVHRMISDLRQAYKVISPTSGTSSDAMDFVMWEEVSGQQQLRRVQYFCNSGNLQTGYNQCLRYDDVSTDSAAPGVAMTVTPVVVIPRVLNETSNDPNDPVFQNLSSPDGSTGRPTYGEVHLHTPGAGNRHVGYAYWATFNESFDMRQLTFAH